jgi:hypothetical protein
MTIAEGRPGPEFTLKSESGDTVRLSALRGTQSSSISIPKTTRAELFRSKFVSPSEWCLDGAVLSPNLRARGSELGIRPPVNLG